MSVLLSLRPRYAEAILSGEKEFEFRRTLFKRENVKKVYLYSNHSVQKILGYFKVGKTLEGSPEEIWNKFNKHAFISKEDFFEYFDDAKTAYAIEVKKPHRFSKPLDPFKSMEDFTPPQSFYYISDAEIFGLDSIKRL